MFSGAKHKLQQWRQKKMPVKIMEGVPREGFLQKATKVTEQLQNLHCEGKSVISQLNLQVKALSEIGEDTTVVTEKITLLEDHVKTIEKGLEESEVFTTFFECVQLLNNQVQKDTSEIKDLHRQASSLVKENRKLRTELQIFQDHHERSQNRAVELEIQVDHLKFMSSLPNEYIPFFGNDETTEGKESKEGNEEEQFAIKPQVAIPFLEEEDSLDYAGSYILSVLDTLDFSDNSRLKILFDLIKSYVKGQAYDIAIPLLKTTIEDLVSKYEPKEKIVFTMMEILATVYNMTQRFADAIEVQKEILDIRKESMEEETIGLARTLSCLALLHGKTGKIKTARNYCRQSLDLKNKVYGENDLETAKELHNMGVLYTYDEKYLKAIDCLTTAINIIRSSKKRSVYCLARAASNLASIHVQNEELPEAKCLFGSTLRFLQKHFDKMLQEKNITKEDILEDENKLEEIAECKNKSEIKRIVRLMAEVTEKSNALSHVKLNDVNKVIEKYRQISEEE